MEHINSIWQIKKIMEENNLIFHKGLGQNFLFDEHYLNKIVDSGDITKEDTVIEIGPGLGVLTTRLALKAKKVIAIEIDSNIVPVLKKLTADCGNVEIICKDVMKTDINKLVENEKSVKIVANLPYYITTPIIMKLLEEKVNAKCIVVMIQKEVALRLVAEPSSKDFGAITLAVNYYSKPKVMFTVPAGAFIPAPKVESAVVRMDILKEKEVNPVDEKFMFKVIKASFGQRRKTFVNGVSSALKLEKSKIAEALKSCDLDEKTRGENLSLEKFCSISNFLINLKE